MVNAYNGCLKLLLPEDIEIQQQKNFEFSENCMAINYFLKQAPFYINNKCLFLQLKQINDYLNKLKALHVNVCIFYIISYTIRIIDESISSVWFTVMINTYNKNIEQIAIDNFLKQ